MKVPAPAKSAEPELRSARRQHDGPRSSMPEADLLSLQRHLGNQAVLGFVPGLGSPLDGSLRSRMEQRFGHDFRSVRVHAGPEAARLADAAGAHALTAGDDILFGAGEFAPATPPGEQLLAHELAHVAQQRAGGAEVQLAPKSNAKPDPKEAEARVAATEYVKTYTYVFEGKAVTLTEAQYRAEVARALHNIDVDLRRVEGIAANHRETHDDFLRNTHNVFGVVSDIMADTAPPTLGIWSWPSSAISRGRDAVANGNLAGAARQLQLAQDALRDAEREWNSYIDATTGGGAKAIAYLEVTRDISFGIAIGAAAIVAAPVVAAGAAAAAGGVGLTGAAATTATVLGTGATITTGGAVVGAGLRGGTSAGGQLLAGGKVSGAEVLREAKEGGKRGAVDAASAVTGFGAAKGLGAAKTIAGGIAKGAAAGAAGGGAAGALGGTLEGKSAGEIAKDTLKGTLAGAVGGGVGGGVGTRLGDTSTAARLIGGAGGGAAGGAAGAALEGASPKEIGKAALTGAALGGVQGVAAGHEPPAKGKGGKSKSSPVRAADALEPAKAAPPPTQAAAPEPVPAAKPPAPGKSPAPSKAAKDAASENTKAAVRGATSTRRTIRRHKVSDPEVVTVSGGRKRPSLMPDEARAAKVKAGKASVERLREKGQDLPSRQRRKTLAGTKAGETISGVKPIKGFDEVTPKDVAAVADEIGHKLAPAGAMDRVEEGGFPGEFHASHAEKKTAVARPNAPVEVNHPMCEDCIGFFKALAVKRSAPQVVTDPDAQRVFHPNGDVTEYHHDGTVMHYHADGSVSVEPARR